MDSTSPEHSPAHLIGIRSLFTEGYDIFKKLLKPLLTINAILVGSYVLFGICVGIEIVIGTLASESGTAPVLLIVILVLLAMAETIALLYVVMWIILTLQTVIRSKDPSLRIREAFKVTRTLVWPFIWMNILVGVVTLGLIIVGEIILVALLTLAALTHIALLTIAVTIVGFLILAVGYVMVLTAFGFCNWTFLVEDARGMQALKKSRSLSHGRFWAVFGRLAVLGVVYMVIAIILLAIVEGLRMLAGNPGYAIGELINVAASFFILPLFLSCHYVLYESLHTR